MTSRTALFVGVTLALLVGCAPAATREAPIGSAAADLRDVHLQAAKLTNAACIGCHAAVVSRTSADAVTPTFHFIHVERQGLTCGSCHKAVNIAAQRPTLLVEPSLCATCHEPFQKPFQKRAGR